MPKKNFKVSIKNNDKENKSRITAIVEENKIKYMEKDNTTVLFDYEKKHLVRENKEFRMDYFFEKNKETNGSIKMKELNNMIPIKIKTTKMKVERYNIEIFFEIEEDKFLYQIEEI